MSEDQRDTGANGAHRDATGGREFGRRSGPGERPKRAPGAGYGRRQLITSALAARLLMVSPERVRQLSKEGWIEKQGRDQFLLVDVVQGYIRFRK